jgi:DDE domain
LVGEIAQPRHKRVAQQKAQAEQLFGEAVRVGVVLPWTQDRIVLQQSVEHIERFAGRARNYPSAKHTVLVGGMECHHRPVQYLNNILEQDHRAIKRRCRASQWFRSFWSARRTIAGYEAIYMIRKGQAAWSKATGAFHHFIVSLFAVAV